jgi:hypothetical protein
MHVRPTTEGQNHDPEALPEGREGSQSYTAEYRFLQKNHCSTIKKSEFFTIKISSFYKLGAYEKCPFCVGKRYAPQSVKITGFLQNCAHAISPRVLQK